MVVVAVIMVLLVITVGAADSPCLLVGWLLHVPATCECISGTDLLNCTCCHAETEVAGQTFHLTQSQYTDTGPTSPSTDPITPGAWQGTVTGMPILKSLV